jgi:hypothetical protein
MTPEDEYNAQMAYPLAKEVTQALIDVLGLMLSLNCPPEITLHCLRRG